MTHRLDVIYDTWHACTKCDLAATRRLTPCIGWGEGTDYMIIVDTPSLDHDGDYPLVGDFNSLLMSLLVQADIRKDTYFVTAAVACPPYTSIPQNPDDPVNSMMDVPRTPAARERDACSPRVRELVYTLDPRMIFAFGDDAWKSLVGTKARGSSKTVNAAQGEFFEAQIEGVLHPVIYPLMAFVSLKALMANPSTATHGPIARTLRGLDTARTYVNRLRAYEQADIDAAQE